MMYSRSIGGRLLSLPCRRDAVIMRIRASVLFVLLLLANFALGQDNAQQPAREELDITMQIIADPDATLPDEVVRRIPLPVRKPAAAAERRATPEAAEKGQERAREAKELGREMSEGAKERAQEAAEQREQARRSQADERRRNPGPPTDPPRPPRTPPRP